MGEKSTICFPLCQKSSTEQEVSNTVSCLPPNFVGCETNGDCCGDAICNYEGSSNLNGNKVCRNNAVEKEVSNTVSCLPPNFVGCKTNGDCCGDAICKYEGSSNLNGNKVCRNNAVVNVGSTY